MITYQAAKTEDAAAIAQLHALSWEQHYQDEFTQHYLEHEVRTDRLQVWTDRMKQPVAEQYVVLAKEGDELCGFACVYLNRDETWGALLDNLHVLQAHKGKGIGRKLMQVAAQWVLAEQHDSMMYLWVLTSNEGASTFYRQIGGEMVEKTRMDNPGGGSSSVLRYVWSDLNRLINTGR